MTCFLPPYLLKSGDYECNILPPVLQQKPFGKAAIKIGKAVKLLEYKNKMLESIFISFSFSFCARVNSHVDDLVKLLIVPEKSRFHASLFVHDWFR